MKIIPILAVLTTLCIACIAQKQPVKDGSTLKYCTNVGPVEITIHGDSATGRYLLTVTPERKRGIIKGSYSNGLFQGTWDDPDGVGRIIIGFNPDLTRFLAMYNTSKDASHWYNEWKGVSKNIYQQLAADEKKGLECDWK
jgi:hypothetical protein